MHMSYALPLLVLQSLPCPLALHNVKYAPLNSADKSNRAVITNIGPAFKVFRIDIVLRTLRVTFPLLIGLGRKVVRYVSPEV
jgi:hypothetical protein